MCVESRGGCCSRLPGDIGNVLRGLAYERRLRLSWVAPGSGGAAVGGAGRWEQQKSFVCSFGCCLGPGTGAWELGSDSLAGASPGCSLVYPKWNTHWGGVGSERGY